MIWLLVFISIIVALIFKSFWVGCVFLTVTCYIYLNRKEKAEKKTSEKIQPNHKNEIEDTAVKEAKRIRDLAEKKSKEAKNKGLDDLVVKVYDETKYFPSWIKRGRESVPMVVSLSEKIDKVKDSDKEGYTLTINDSLYTIQTREWQGYSSDDKYVDIEVLENGDKKFEVGCSRTDDEWATYLNPTSVHAYKQGKWEKDFQSLLDEIKKLEKSREVKRLTDSEELNKLKKNFDLE